MHTCDAVTVSVYNPGMNVYGTNTNDDSVAATEGIVGDVAPLGMVTTAHCVIIMAAVPLLIHGLMVTMDVALNGKFRRVKYE